MAYAVECLERDAFVATVDGGRRSRRAGNGTAPGLSSNQPDEAFEIIDRRGDQRSPRVNLKMSAAVGTPKGRSSTQ